LWVETSSWAHHRAEHCHSARHAKPKYGQRAYRGCQFDNIAKTATSIVRFRSAMITVRVGLGRLRRRRRIESIEGTSRLLVRAAGRCRPIPGVRSGRARRCETGDRNQRRYRCGKGEIFRDHGSVSFAVSSSLLSGGAHRGIGMRARIGHPIISVA
jgi:hypothetical protein